MTETLTRSIDAYMEEMQRILADLPRDAMLMNVLHLYRAWQDRNQIFVLGNGGSASTASHVANDLSKATIVPGLPRLRVLGLADNVALMTAWANDTSYDQIFKEQLENLLETGDVVIAISASGNSPNVLRAVEFAKQRNAVTIGWTGACGGRLKDLCDLCVHAPTDDVGMIESAHLVIDHLVTKQLWQYLEASKVNRGARPHAITGVGIPAALPLAAFDNAQFRALRRRTVGRPRVRAAEPTERPPEGETLS